MEHTTEPWRVAVGYKAELRASDDITVIADFNVSGTKPANVVERLNAQRAFNCVNACKGINPNVVPALIKDIQGMMQALALSRPEEELLKDYGMLGIHNIRAVKDSLDALKTTQ